MDGVYLARHPEHRALLRRTRFKPRVHRRAVLLAGPGLLPLAARPGAPSSDPEAAPSVAPNGAPEPSIRLPPQLSPEPAPGPTSAAALPVAPLPELALRRDRQARVAGPRPHRLGAWWTSIPPALIGRVKSFRIKSVFAKQSIDYRTPTSTTPAASVGAVDEGANNVSPISGVAMNEDGFGVVVGADNASAKVDISNDPQCPGCRQFDAVLGGDIVHQVGESQLEVTYQPRILEDEIRHRDYSMHAAHAMFLAAGRNSGASQKVISSFLHRVFLTSGCLTPSFTRLSHGAELP